MHHVERKEYLLPCGFRVHESWAALRRSWLGFKIAHSRGDMAKMKYYAAFIHKVQKELGIGLTVFEPGLLDYEERTNSEGQPDTPNAEDAEDRSLTIANSVSESDMESLPDFEEIMTNVSANIAVPEPRQEIFEPYEEFEPREDVSENSSEYLQEEKMNENYMDADMDVPSVQDGMFATYEDRTDSSCEYDYFADIDKVNVEEQKINLESSCWLDPELEKTKLKKEKDRQLHSCFYRGQHAPDNDEDSS
jgi:hypothetical protein